MTGNEKELLKKLNELEKRCDTLSAKFSEKEKQSQKETAQEQIMILADKIFKESKGAMSYSDALNAANEAAPTMFKQFADDYLSSF